jgi:hypothetical protein
VGNNRHFVIAADGWYWLDANGRWEEIGLSSVDNVPVNKWQRTFYANLDLDNRHRIYCEYLRDFNQVLIVYPKVGDDVSANGPQEVWIYDIDSDRIFIDRYPVNVFGGYDVTVRGPLTYALAGGTATPTGYEDFTFPLTYSGAGSMSYAFAAGAFGLEQLIHGNNGGNVFVHDPDLTTRDNVPIPWFYEVPVRQLHSSRYNLTADRVQVEYIHAGNLASSVVGAFFCNATAGAQSRTLDLTVGDEDEIRSAKEFYRFTSISLGFRLGGVGPFMIRAFDLDLWADLIEGGR